MRWWHRFRKHKVENELAYHRGLGGIESLQGAIFNCSCGEVWYKRF